MEMGGSGKAEKQQRVVPSGKVYRQKFDAEVDIILFASIIYDFMYKSLTQAML